MKNVYKIFTYVLILLIIMFVYFGLGKPVKVALLSDFQAERGSFSTNSIIGGRIAEKYINSNKGILGRHTKLVTKNTNFDKPEEIIDFLKSENIDVMITTADNESLIKLTPYLNKNNITCISIGATSTELSKKDDSIFRMFPDDSKEVEALLNYLDKTETKKGFFVIYNINNKAYNASVIEQIEKHGGKVLAEDFWINNPLAYIPKNPELMKKGMPILLLASPTDSVAIIQVLKNYGINGQVYGMSWSGDYNLLNYGGKSIEGFTFVSPIDFAEKKGKREEFIRQLKNTYNKKDGIVSIGVYNAYLTIKEIYIDEFNKHKTFKELLKERGNFQGFNGNISFDKYGDSQGREYIFTVKNGQFTKLEE